MTGLNTTGIFSTDKVMIVLALKIMNTKEELPQCVRSSLETVPAEQEVQEAAPVCSAIEFSAHLVQIVIVLSRYVPALQATERILKFRFTFINMS